MVKSRKKVPRLPPLDLLPAVSANCRRTESSFSCAPVLGPAGCQCRCHERQKQLVVAGNGIAMRFRSALPPAGSGGTLYYILQRTIVLNKVKVRRSNGAQGDAEI